MKKIKAYAAALTSLALLTSGASSVYGAGSISSYAPDDIEIKVYTDGFEYDGEVRLINQTAYVSLREFACEVDNAVVSWDYDTNTAKVVTDSLILTAEEHSEYMIANGRYLWCSEGIFTDDGVIYVPLKRAAQAFGFDNEWVYDENASYLTRKAGAIEAAESYYDEDELYWLSRIINAEAGGEPFDGKLAVGTVVLNRVDDDEFPDELYDVIFDNDCGVQFTPTVNGAIEKTPNDDSVIAAKLCLDGYRISDSILYFLNQEIAENFWVPQNCTYVMSIGGHDFYS